MHVGIRLVKGMTQAMNRLALLRAALFVAALLLLAGLTPCQAICCPICGQPTLTLAERYAQSDAAILAAWVSAQTARNGKLDAATYEVVEVARAGEAKSTKGDRITVPGYHAGKPGNLVLLMGRKLENGDLKWDDIPIDVTETSYQYVRQAPAPEVQWSKRLEFFVRFLEFPDLTIANDAFAEFVNAPAADIAATADKLPREKLRRWLFDPATPINRIAAYGLMLGLCGTADDARRMEQKIFDKQDENRIGLEGIVVGYLLLTGEEGLKKIAKEKLVPTAGQEGDVFPCLQALRYLWTYGNGKIEKASLRRAMRLLVEQPQYASTAITDLARWKDWGLQSRLMELYGTTDFDDAQAKEAIVGFLLACTKDVPAGDKDAVPQHVLDARSNLEKLRKRDPRVVAEIERFFTPK